MSNRNENNDYPLNHGSKKYVVYVDDNFHHMDESERYKLGEFWSCEEAIEACKKIVDEFFNRTFDQNISYEELYNGYTMYGEKTLSSSQVIEIASSQHGIMRKNVVGNW